MTCRGIIKSILVGREVKSIKGLFKSVGRKGPEGEIFGLIDIAKSQEPGDCPFRYSWGLECYCDNQSYIKQYIEQHKDKFPELYEK